MRGHITGKSLFVALAMAATVGVLITGYAFAQTPPATTAPPAPAAAAPEAPAARPSVKGVVTNNGVNIRNGPGTEYSVFYSAPLGTELDVLAQQGQWYETDFPIKGFSWISREYFQRIDDKTGIVTGSAVRVRGGPGTQYDSLYIVPNAYKFQILGADPRGDWYKVAPMPGATAWILAGYVRLSGPLPAGGAPSAATVTPPTTTVAPPPTTVETIPPGTVVPPTTETAVTPETPEPPKPPEEAPKPDPYAEKFADAEKLFDSEVKKENPIEWNLPALVAAYTEIADKSASAATRGVSRQRLVQLKYYKNFQDRVKELGKIDEELSKRLKELERQRAEQITAIPEAMEAPFIAAGVVDKFYIKGIGGATHKLVEAGTILYLLKSDVVDLSANEGKRCGVRGKIVTVPSANIRVIEVESLKPLAEKPPAPDK